MNYLLAKYKNLAFEIFRGVFGRRRGFGRRVNQMAKLSYLCLSLPFELIGDVAFLRKRFGPMELDIPQKVLIIKVDQLGDVISSTFLLAAFKNKYPNAELHLLVNKEAEVLVSNNPFVNKIHLWEDSRMSVLFGRERGKKISFFSSLKANRKTLGFLKQEGYDVVVNARPFPPSSNIPWKRIRGKRLIAFDTSEQSFLADVVCTHNFREEEWKNHLKLLSVLNVDGSNSRFGTGFFNFDVAFLVRSKLLEAGNGFVVISPITFDKDRLWPVQYWRRTLEFLSEKGANVVLTGLSSQLRYLNEIANGFDREKIKVAGEISIPMLAHLIKSSAFLIGIDSFPVNLAVTLGKDVICLVNEKNYYVKGLSKSILVNGKCVLPLLGNVRIFSTSSSPAAVLSAMQVLMVKHIRSF